VGKRSVKTCIVAGTVGGALLGLALAAKRRGAGDSRTPSPTLWDKMEEAMARMPETFPPRVMYDNIAAIRQDTIRIIEMLEHPETSHEEETGEHSSR